MLLAYTFGGSRGPLVAFIFVWFARRRSGSCDATTSASAAKILWIVVILVIPVVGLFVYFLWDAARPRTT